MFWHPFTTNAVWEFARCGKTNLMDVSANELGMAFVGRAGPHGATLFGRTWATNGIRVTEGEIVLARRTEQAYPVYVIRFERHATNDFGRTRIEYLMVPTNRPPNKSLVYPTMVF